MPGNLNLLELDGAQRLAINDLPEWKASCKLNLMEWDVAASGRDLHLIESDGADIG